MSERIGSPLDGGYPPFKSLFRTSIVLAVHALDMHIRRQLSGLVSALVFISSASISVAAAAAPNDGNCDLTGLGTEASPHAVSNVSDLLEIRDCDLFNAKTWFQLQQDIELSGNWTPLSSFYGYLDGNEKTISNLTINNPADDDIGLFETLQDGSRVNDLTVRFNSVIGRDGVGVLAGMSRANLTNISVEPMAPMAPSPVTIVSYSISSGSAVFTTSASHSVTVGSQLHFPTGSPWQQWGVADSYHVTAVTSNTITVDGPEGISASVNAATFAVTYPSGLAAQANLPNIIGRDNVGAISGVYSGFYLNDFRNTVSLSPLTQAQDIRATANISARSGSGGLFGLMQNATLANAVFAGSLTQSYGSFSSEGVLGGLVGNAISSRIDVSDSDVVMSSPVDLVGGIAGIMQGTSVPYCATYPLKGVEIDESNGDYRLTVEGNIEVTNGAQILIADQMSSVSEISNGFLGVVLSVSGQVITLSDSLDPISSTVTNEPISSIGFVAEVIPNDGQFSCDYELFGSSTTASITAGMEIASGVIGGAVGNLMGAKVNNLQVDAEIFAVSDGIGGAFGYSQGSDLNDVSLIYGEKSSRIVGRDHVGGLVGIYFGANANANPAPEFQTDATDLTVDGRSPIGGAAVYGRDMVGGVIGFLQNATITDNASGAAVYGRDYVGGLVGNHTYGTVVGSTYSGTVVEGSGDNVGGLVGFQQGLQNPVVVTSASSVGSTTELNFADPHLYTVGDRLAAYLPDLGISELVRIDAVIDKDTIVVGIASDGSPITGQSNTVRRLPAVVDSHVTQSVQIGNAAGIRGMSNVGGLVGQQVSGAVIDSTAKLQVRPSADNEEKFGGLVGWFQGGRSTAYYHKVINSSATLPILVSGSGFTAINKFGGLIGEALWVSIENSYFEGELNIGSQAGASRIGGLVGNAVDVPIVSSYAWASISGGTSLIGGLVGEQTRVDMDAADAAITGSYFMGDINAPGASNVGGLAGDMGHHIEFSHASGSIVANSVVGGLVGANSSNKNISTSYFDGTVERSDTPSANEVLGDSNSTGTVQAFWNLDAMPDSQLAGGKTEQELAALSTFAAWTDFANFFEMPNAQVTTKPFPTLTALKRAPGALTLSPALNLDGHQVGQPISTVTGSAKGYPMPVISDYSGNVPNGLEISGMQISGSPEPGAFSFELGAVNTEGFGPRLSFSGNIAYPATPSYSGPLVTSISPSTPMAGELVTVAGERLEGVTSVILNGTEIPVSAKSTGFEFTVPADAPLGEADLILVGSSGRLVIQDAINVKVASQSLSLVIRRISDGEAKVYAKYPVDAGKIQFVVNGNERGWIRAATTGDVKLRKVGGAPYFVRTVKLQPGRNVIEIFVEGESLKRVIYTR